MYCYTVLCCTRRRRRRRIVFASLIEQGCNDYARTVNRNTYVVCTTTLLLSLLIL